MAEFENRAARIKITSGYSVFVEENWKPRHKGISNEQAYKEAGSEWEALDKKVKDKYNQEAKKRGKRQNMKPLTTDQVPIELNEKREKEKKLLYQKMKDEVGKSLQLPLEILLKKKFNVINVQVYTVIKNRDNTEVYVPAEVAIVQFNVEEGITREWHGIFEYKNIAYGHESDVKRDTAGTHKITPLKNPEVEDDQRRDLIEFGNEILKELQQGDVFYCMAHGPVIRERYHDSARYFLNHLLDYCDLPKSAFKDVRNIQHTDLLKLYPLDEMCYHLLNNIWELTDGSGPKKFPEVRFATQFIDEKFSIKFCTQINLACAYHYNEVIDHSLYCALVTARGWTYTILKEACLMAFGNAKEPRQSPPDMSQSRLPVMGPENETKEDKDEVWDHPSPKKTVIEKMQGMNFGDGRGGGGGRDGGRGGGRGGGSMRL